MIEKVRNPWGKDIPFIRSFMPQAIIFCVDKNLLDLISLSQFCLFDDTRLDTMQNSTKNILVQSISILQCWDYTLD